MPIQTRRLASDNDHQNRRPSAQKQSVTSTGRPRMTGRGASQNSLRGTGGLSEGKRYRKTQDRPKGENDAGQETTKPEPEPEEQEQKDQTPTTDQANNVNGQAQQEENKEIPDENGDRPVTPETPTRRFSSSRRRGARTPSPTPPPEQPKQFAIETFNKNIDEFAATFSSDRFSHVTDDYPADDLISVVSTVTESINEFKEQTLSSQSHLAELKEKMKIVKERIQMSVMKKSSELRIDDHPQSIEERELTTKLTRLNAQVAQANAELAEALRLSAETESTAVEAQLAAERAKEEAQGIQEEIEYRKRVEERRRIEEEKRMEEARRQKEMERLREEEKMREKEDEWRRKEAGGEKTPYWEKWPEYEYKLDTNQLACIVRGHPTKFSHHQLSCTTIEHLQCPLTFGENEELVSQILSLTGNSDDVQLEEPMVVCVPYIGARHGHSTHVSREVVVKAFIDKRWTELETRDETLDSHKEYKFAVAELKCLTKVAAFTRLKRDYVTLSKKGGKVTSSFDQRITINVPRNGIPGNDHVLMEVQPVDTTSVNDLRQRSPTCKGLLTSSPIVKMAWESDCFTKPVTVTVPCPPNPAKAKKIAAMRKAKEEKMKHPQRVVLVLPHEQEALDREKKSKLQKLQEELAEQEREDTEQKPTRWYMGEYANNDDDETDRLVLVSGSGTGKWTPVPDVNIMQVKLDLLQFDLDKPLDKFMVLRTRTNVEEDSIAPIAGEVSRFLTQRFAQVILRQKSDDPFDTVLSVVPVSKTEKTLKKLSEEGYDDGPDPSQVLSINEGNLIEVQFRGNVTKKDTEEIHFVYNSNIDSETDFYACEVDKYLQRNFPVYRGVVEVFRKYEVKMTKRPRVRDSVDENEAPPIEYKRELMCEMPINIPKYHVEATTTPVKAPIMIRNSRDPVNEGLMRQVADELGDEWKILASHLNISKARLQAILRQYVDLSDTDAKFAMLMTWLKKTPKAVDKVACLSNALLKSGRGDISEEIRERARDFRQQHASA